MNKKMIKQVLAFTMLILVSFNSVYVKANAPSIVVTDNGTFGNISTEVPTVDDLGSYYRVTLNKLKCKAGKTIDNLGNLSATVDGKVTTIAPSDYNISTDGTVDNPPHTFNSNIGYGLTVLDGPLAGNCKTDILKTVGQIDVTNDVYKLSDTGQMSDKTYVETNEEQSNRIIQYSYSDYYNLYNKVEMPFSYTYNKIYPERHEWAGTLTVDSSTYNCVNISSEQRSLTDVRNPGEMPDTYTEDIVYYGAEYPRFNIDGKEYHPTMSPLMSRHSIDYYKQQMLNQGLRLYDYMFYTLGQATFRYSHTGIWQGQTMKFYDATINVKNLTPTITYSGTLTDETPLYKITFTIPKTDTGGGGTTNPSGGSGGQITFTPSQTPWTNIGKSSGFPVTVSLDKPVVVHQWVQNYTKTTTTTTWSSTYTPAVPPDKDGKGGSAESWSAPSYTSNTVTTTIPVTFNVTYTANPIVITGGCTPSTVSNSGGSILVPEGGYRNLSASTTYVQKKDEPVAPLPDNIPSTGDEHNGSSTTSNITVGNLQQLVPPANPTGSAGTYNVDYTTPWITSFATPSAQASTTGWYNNKNDTVGSYALDFSMSEKYSGYNNTTLSLVDRSHYNGNVSTTINGAPTSNSSTDNQTRRFIVYNGMYNVNAHLQDLAGNTNNETYGEYLVDTQDPQATFSVPNGTYFETDRGAYKIGDQWYANISFSDNLSGIDKNNASFYWTYSSATPTTWKKLTFDNQSMPGYGVDRSSEVITQKIAKPVGDNLYLHLFFYDMAGNATYKTFGPFEDPIKLKDFKCTYIFDPYWAEVFNQLKPGAIHPVQDITKIGNYVDFTKYTGVTYPVSKMPITNEENPYYRNAMPEKGWEFDFQITSEYMYRDTDKITFTPTIYWCPSKQYEQHGSQISTVDDMDLSKRVKVDVYYPWQGNPLLKVGLPYEVTNGFKIPQWINGNKYYIGGYSEVTLDKRVRYDQYNVPFSSWKGKIQYINGKEQYWLGNYSIPSEAVLLPSGNPVNSDYFLKGGYIIVQFNIKGYKNGKETGGSQLIYNYIPNQWESEGGPKRNFAPGDTIVLDNSWSADDWWTIHTTH